MLSFRKMKKIVFATNNSHKLDEARAICGAGIEIVGLSEIGCHENLPETSDTLEGNALQKACYVRDRYGIDCFADDTGLLVDALDGAPGVYTARFAGEHCSSADNINLLLKKLDGEQNRRAEFCTVVALAHKAGGAECFSGSVEGDIAESRQGTGGFGYDPVFVPRESGISFAMMLPEAKNAISHRGRAMRKLTEYLKSNNKV